MDDWLDRFATALGMPPIDTAEVETILDLAREVAHGTERKNAPLAAWLAGRAAVSPVDALATARRTLAGPGGSGDSGDAVSPPRS